MPLRPPRRPREKKVGGHTKGEWLVWLSLWRPDAPIVPKLRKLVLEAFRGR